ncbi:MULTISPECIES: hypothetical protein [Aphanothece]|uniref:hypothetical protein n=1 Tax=Aphanothece TaxID=1121 RepID=UPI003984C18E
MVKPKAFRPWSPEETLLPPSPVEWLPENHLLFFPLDLAAELDLQAIHSHSMPTSEPWPLWIERIATSSIHHRE